MNPDQTPNTILLLEDDLSLAEGLCYSLQKNGYAVENAESVQEAMGLLSQKSYDLLLLDVTLPDGTGFQVCETLRKEQNQVPIIFLTASDDEMNIIRGLDSGGDDYIGKPFKLGELLSRIRALLRRAGMKQSTEIPDDNNGYQASPDILKSDNSQHASQTALMLNKNLVCGDIQIDLAGSRVFLRGERLELTQVEYRLLCLLVRSHDRVVTREILFEELWDGFGNFVDDNTLSVYIRRLRQKIEKDPSRPEHLITARGFGYCWQEVKEP